MPIHGSLTMHFKNYNNNLTIHKNLSFFVQACSFWGCCTMNFVEFPRTSISSQSQEIHRLTSLPFQWVLSFPKDPRAEWGCRKKHPSTIRVCRITKGLPTPFTPDEPNSLQSPSASAFSHPSNIRAKKHPHIQTPPLYLYRFFYIYA